VRNATAPEKWIEYIHRYGFKAGQASVQSITFVISMGCPPSTEKHQWMTGAKMVQRMMSGALQREQIRCEASLTTLNNGISFETATLQ
jgi:hypothetical protein